MTEATGRPATPEPDYDHYEDCPRHPEHLDYNLAAERCRCAAINAEEEAYSAEPLNMAALEDGSETTPLW